MTSLPQIIIALIFVSLIPSLSHAEEKVVFVVDVIRHGDRNPGTEIPRAPYPWKGELGALTEAGVQRELKLGSELRKEYVEQTQLLPEQYQEGTLYVRSTDFSRTKESAKALLEGLYPPNTRGGASISIESVKKADEDLLLIKPSGNPFSMIKMYFWKKRFWKEHTKDLKNELKKWSEATGLKLETIDNLTAVSDNLYIRQQNKITFPPGIDAKDVEKIISLDEFAIVSYFEHSEVSRPSGLKLISRIKEYFEQVKEGKTQLKYVYYSAHDSTVMSILSTLGIKFRFPGYASRVSFRLLQGPQGYQVRVSHDGKPVTASSCKDSLCPYSQFFEILK